MTRQFIQLRNATGVLTTQRLTPILQAYVSHQKLLENGNRWVLRGGETMTIDAGTNGATTLSRMNLSGYVGHVTTFSSNQIKSNRTIL